MSQSLQILQLFFTIRTLCDSSKFQNHSFQTKTCFKIISCYNRLGNFGHISLSTWLQCYLTFVIRNPEVSFGAGLLPGLELATLLVGYRLDCKANAQNTLSNPVPLLPDCLTLATGCNPTVFWSGGVKSLSSGCDQCLTTNTSYSWLLQTMTICWVRRWRRLASNTGYFNLSYFTKRS